MIELTMGKFLLFPINQTKLIAISKIERIAQLSIDHFLEKIDQIVNFKKNNSSPEEVAKYFSITFKGTSGLSDL